jgi:hypothetical protein
LIDTPDEPIELSLDALKIVLSDEASVIVSRNIRAEMARNEPAVTGEYLATILGVSQSVTSKRLRGVVPWEWGELVIVARTLKVRLSVLLVGLGAENVAA